MKRVRREVSVDPELLESMESRRVYQPTFNIFDAMMRGVDDYEEDDPETYIKLRGAITNALETLSEKDRYCLRAIYDERLTYAQLGQQLGYRPQKGGSPQAHRATQRALDRLKEAILQDDFLATYVRGRYNE